MATRVANAKRVHSMTDTIGDYIWQHCYLCEKPITDKDVLVRNGGLQVVVKKRYGLRLRAHRSCWLARYGGPQERQASMELEATA